jgi:poly(U)-specific endoribonuclease
MVRGSLSAKHRSPAWATSHCIFNSVFVGEIRDDKISGFHNWIQFCIEEKKGTVDYRGYIKPKSKTNADTDSNDHVLTLQFHWKGVEKQIGSIFIGVSPEWEMS